MSRAFPLPGASAGAPPREEFVPPGEAGYAYKNRPLTIGYGQTESTSSLTFLGPDDHRIPAEPGTERERKLLALAAKAEEQAETVEQEAERSQD